MHTALSIRMCKKETARLLKDHGLSFPVFSLCAILFFALIGFVALSQYITAVMEAIVGSIPHLWRLLLTASIFLLLVLFLAAPLWLGIKSVVFKGLFCGRIDLSDAVLYFTQKRRYFFAAKRQWRAILRLFGCVFLFFLIALLGAKVARALTLSQRPAAATAVLVVSILFLLCTILLYFHLRADAFLLDAAFLSAPLLRYRQLRVISLRRMQLGRKCLFRLNLSFLPLFFVSLLLLGFPLIFVLPYYVGARVSLAYRLLSD